MVNRVFKDFMNYVKKKEKKIRDTEKKRVRIKKIISQNRNKLNILNRELKSLITNKKNDFVICRLLDYISTSFGITITRALKNYSY